MNPLPNLRNILSKNIMKLSIFDFSNHCDWLEYVYKEQIKKRDKLNLEKWALELGYRSPSLLTMIIKGKRLPSFEFCEKISYNLGLNDKERRYFQLLVQHSKQIEKGASTEITLHELSKISGKSEHTIKLSEFEFISDWQFLVLKQLIKTKGFRENPEWISRRLNRKISPANVKKSIEKLVELGIFGRNKAGKLTLKRERLETVNDIPSPALKNHHLAMIDRAKEALVEQSVENRQFNSMTFRMDSDKKAEAKEKILQFIYEFNEEYGKEKAGGEVYQLNLQLFSHEKLEEEKK